MTLNAWVHGWAISRGTPAPVAVDDGWRIEVGLQNHRRRYVLDDPRHETLTRLGREQAVPGTWIKIAGEAGRLRAALPPGWEHGETLHLMTTTFVAGEVTAPPPPYTIRLTGEGALVTAAVLDGEERIAASAKLVTVGDFGIVDQVETEPAHRRRGLGSIVMRLLANHARDLGVHRGVLVATGDGRHLYRSLGWAVRAPIAAAYVPEPRTP